MDTIKRQIRQQMLRDIIHQGSDILKYIDSIESQVKKILSGISDLKKYNCIYFVGCGDSHYTGKAARYAFLEYSKLPVYALEAFEFNQYEHKYIDKNSIVIAISISGQVGTTLKSLSIAKELGCFVMGINATPGSKIYSITPNIIDIGVRVTEPGPVPQTIHYLANMTTSFIISLLIGKMNGSIDSDEYTSLLNEIKKNCALIESNVQRLKPQVEQLVSNILDKGPYVFIGSGPNYATAEFAVAKLHEAACMGGIYQETEEWAHEQYFMTKPYVVSFVFAQKGFGFDRAVDILKSIKKIQGIAVAVTNSSEETESIADYNFDIECSSYEIFSPLITKIVPELFAYSIADQLDIRPFDYDNIVRKKTCEETIYNDGVSAEDVNRKNIVLR
jgi:glucosamine 6-phosphate synthetase-like amidotransferase/phosphosugar isomerase protein